MKHKWLLLLISISVLSSCTPNKSTSKEDLPPLKTAYENAFKIGCAVNHEIVTGSIKNSRELVIENFNSITAENVMKAEVLNPSPGVFDFEKADAFVNFGQENDMFIIGHTLIWHNQCPEWFFKNVDSTAKTKEQVIENMHHYIQTVASRYAGKVHAWDVVNEVIDNDGTYRPTSWVNAFGDGDELVRTAFSLAEKYAPDTELYYNDFNAWRPSKRDGIIKMIKMLQNSGIRIDGIGIQGHWGLNFPENKYIEEAIEAYSALGIKVMITELDVDVLPLTKEGQIIGTGMMHDQFQLEEFKKFLDPYQNGLPEEIENQLAARYKELFEIFYKHKDRIDRVTTWGLSDDMSWKNDYPIPNRTNYPLLWDRENKAKKALRELYEVVNDK
jgi:endo-1,4-beta-xylanase